VLLQARFDSRSVFSLRSAVAAHAKAAGLGRQHAYDVIIAAYELAANAVRHGAGHGQLRLSGDNGSLCCQVTDPGPAGTDPGPAAPPRRRRRAPVAGRARPRPVDHPAGARMVWNRLPVSYSAC